MAAAGGHRPVRSVQTHDEVVEGVGRVGAGRRETRFQPQTPRDQPRRAAKAISLDPVPSVIQSGAAGDGAGLPAAACVGPCPAWCSDSARGSTAPASSLSGRTLLGRLPHACHLPFPSLGQKRSPCLWVTDHRGRRKHDELHLARARSGQPRLDGEGTRGLARSRSLFWGQLLAAEEGFPRAASTSAASVRPTSGEGSEVGEAT